jgi:hypothetical protein
LGCATEGETESPDVISVNLHNLCSEPMTYIVEGSEDESERSLAPGAVTQVQMGPDQKIAHYDQASSVKGWVNNNGAHIWFNSSCTGIGTTEDPNADPATLEREFAQARAQSFFLTSVETAEETPTDVADELAGLVAEQLPQGELVQYESMKNTIHAIEALYAAHGYPHANVIPKTEEDGASDKLALEIVVQPGPTE